MKKIFYLLLFVGFAASGQVGNDFKKTKQAAYVISKIGSTIYAFPKENTIYPLYSGTDAYTVIQAVIDTLTPTGSAGTGGGEIYIGDGTYLLTDELVIDGWEGTGNPYSQLKITGNGYATRIRTTTSGKNCFVIKNAASVIMRDMYIETGSSAASCILFSDAGATTEISTNRSTFDNLYCSSTSTTAPAIYAKNIYWSNFNHIKAENNSYHGIIIYNNSTTTNYGNCNFTFLTARGSSSSPYAGLLITTNTTSRRMNALNFNSYQCQAGYYGVYGDGVQYSNFNFVDIELTTSCIHLAGASSSTQTKGISFNSGYLQPATGGTHITNTSWGIGNSFTNIMCDGDGTSVNVLDQRVSSDLANSYDLMLGSSASTTFTLTAAATTKLIYRKRSDGTVSTSIPNVALLNSAQSFSASKKFSTGTDLSLHNQADETTNYERLRMFVSSNIFNISTEIGGTGTNRTLVLTGNSRSLTLGGTDINGGIKTNTGSSGAGYSAFGVGGGGSFTASSGYQYGITIDPTYNQTSSAGYKTLFISPFEQAIGSNPSYLIDAGTNSAGSGGGTHTTKFSVSNTGAVYFAGSERGAYVAKSSSYTLTANDRTVEVTATGQTMTLPTAVSVSGRRYTIKLTSTTSTGTVGTTSSQTIDGSTTYSLSAQYKYVTVESNGANWIIVANN